MYDSSLSLRDIIRYTNHPHLFVKEQLGIDLDKFPKQKEIINKYFEQDECGIDKYKYLVLLCGMRSGKSYLTSLMALYQLFRFLLIEDIEEWSSRVLGKDIKLTTLHWMCAAKSEKQAYDTLFTKISYMLQDNIDKGGFFSSYNIKFRKGEIEIPEKGYYVWTGPSHASGLVGRTVAFAAIDEFGHLKNSNKPPDGADYVFSFLAKSTMTLGTFGKMAVLSSPVSPDDPICRKLEEAKTGRLPQSIWFHEPTWVMNPFEDKETLRQSCPDEATFMRDFAAIPGYVVYSNDRPKLFDKIILDKSIKNVLLDDSYVDDRPRYIGLDPAVRNDSFGIAIGYYDYETSKIVIDGIKVFEPTEHSIIDAKEVYDFIVNNILDRFTIVGCGIDIDMYAELNQMLQEMIPFYSKKFVNRKHYEDFKFDMLNGNLKVVYHDKLYKELRDIEIVNERRVDHPKNGTKDVADAVVQCYRVIKEYKSKIMPIKCCNIIGFSR